MLELLTTDERLTASKHNILDTQLPRRLEDIISAHGVGAELAAGVCLARARQRGEVDDGVDGGAADAAIRHVGRDERLHHRPHVLEVHLDQPVRAPEPGLAVLGRRGRPPHVEGDDLPRLGEQVDDGAPELARAACDDDAGPAVSGDLAQGAGLVEEGRA